MVGQTTALGVPELPEVETVARLIAPKIVGHAITGTRVTWKRTIGGVSVARFAKCVGGARVTKVWRRAKFIVLELERSGKSAGFLVAHLRMTGRMHVEPKQWDPGPYVKVSLALDDGCSLHFIDVRKFARLLYTQTLEPLLGDLGPEPLSPEFSVERLAQDLLHKKRSLKPLLLDQTFVAGLGNIYVDEALHRASLHPLTRSNGLRRPQVQRLHGEIQAVLTAAIEREGSSFDTFYRTPEGRPGSYQDEFQVYGRTGKPCRACQTPIVRIVVGQRGTHYCPRCQPAPRAPRKRCS